MTATDLDRLLDRLQRLDPGRRSAALARLSPATVTLLRQRAPVPSARVAAARSAVADPVGWAASELPALVPLAPGPHHRAIAGLLDQHGPTGVRAMVAAFRGSGKSTTGTTLLPLVAAVRRSHRFGVLVRAREPDAIAAVASVRGLLDNARHLVDRYPWLEPVNRSEEELRLAGGFTLLARGAGSAIRGLVRPVQGAAVRPDLVVVDDLETEESARSTLQTDRLEEWLVSVVGQLGGPPGTSGTSPLDVVVIGTTLEPDAVVSRAIRGDDPFGGWTRVLFPAEGTVADDGRVVDTAGRHLELVPAPPDATPGDRVATWPQGAPLDYLDRLRDRTPGNPLYVGSRVWSREYAMDPQTSGETLFDVADLLVVPGLADLVAAGEVPVEAVAIGVDPAASQRTTADRSAWTVVARLRLRAVPGVPDPPQGVDPYALAVLEAGADRLSDPQLVAKLTDVARRWSRFRPTVAYEAQGAFVIAARSFARERVATVRPVSVSADKVTRAVPLQGWVEPGRMVVDANLRGTTWWSEFDGFTGTKLDAHDDTVDATVHAAALLTSAWRLDPVPAGQGPRPNPATGAR